MIMMPHNCDEDKTSHTIRCDTERKLLAFQKIAGMGSSPRGYADAFIALRDAIERDRVRIENLQTDLTLKEARLRTQADRMRGLMDTVERYRQQEQRK